MEIDINKIRILAESAERRAKNIHTEVTASKPTLGNNCGCFATINGWTCPYHSFLNDFFYWSGKATSYRGIVAMAEMQAIVEEELDATPSCP